MCVRSCIDDKHAKPIHSSLAARLALSRSSPCSVPLSWHIRWHGTQAGRQRSATYHRTEDVLCMGLQCTQSSISTTVSAALTPAARAAAARAAKSPRTTAGASAASSAASPSLTRYTITLNRTLAYVPGDTKTKYTNYDFSVVGACATRAA